MTQQQFWCQEKYDEETNHPAYFVFYFIEIDGTLRSIHRYLAEQGGNNLPILVCVLVADRAVCASQKDTDHQFQS